jgi:MFS family permease
VTAPDPPRAPASRTGDSEPTLRSLGLTVYAPSFIFSVGQGAVIPIVALAAKDLGASVAMAGLTVALRGIGTMVFDVPAGSMVGRLGERKAMLVATAMLVASLIGCVLAPNVAVFAASMFVMGCAWSVWLLARLAYVSDVMPLHLRGRALSTLGGVARIGNFAGPFLGAVAVGAMGIDGAYYVHIVLAVIGCGVLLAVPDPYESTATTVGHAKVRVLAVAREHAPILRTAGVGTMAIGVLRASRQVVLPLWADHIGLDAATVSIVFGVSSAMDMLLFYPAGLASDRWGRKYVAVPCLTIMATGMILLPLTRSLGPLIVVGIVIGFGNGLGSGIVMTLGADFTPAVGRAEFLGVWRLIGDVGTAGGPLVVSAVESVASLGAASVGVGAIGLAGAALLLGWMPEPLNRRAYPVQVPTADGEGADAPR